MYQRISPFCALRHGTVIRPSRFVNSKGFKTLDLVGQQPEEMPCRLHFQHYLSEVRNIVRYIGIDLHKKSFTVAELYPDGSVGFYDASLDILQSLQEFLDRLQPDDRVAIEATLNSYFLYGLIKPLVAKVVLVDPRKVRPIAESNSKTDKKDAEILARLLMSGLLPGICVPSPETRSVRGLLGHRHKLVREKTAVKNRIHALLGMYGFSSPVSDLFGHEGRKMIEELSMLLPLNAQVELTSCMGLIDSYEEEIKKLDGHLVSIALTDPCVKLLMTIKGVNVITALGISAYVVDITRFPSAKKFAAYAGVVPIVCNSGGKKYCGPITKEGPPVLRWALVEAAQSLVKEPGDFRNLYRRILRKRGESPVTRSKALIACANKLARVIWKMLTEGKSYREYNRPQYERKIKRACKVATPYPHSLEETWEMKYLSPSRKRPPYLHDVESPEITRLYAVHEVMEKAKTKRQRKKRKKAA